MDKKKLRENRNKLVEWSRSQLTGAYLKPDEELVGERAILKFIFSAVSFKQL